ncbi:MAG: sulfatase, partial [Sediminibacterium sp.]|nr:sulfatase [Sediminibacterium sp.]
MQKTIGLVVALLLVHTAGIAQTTPPNIIVIMSDDHDADAISAYNSTLLQTPHIDRIGREGIRFTRAMVGNSLC